MKNSLEAEVITEAERVLKLLRTGRSEEGRAAVSLFDEYLARRGKVRDVNVDALWIQTGIAASNPENSTYVQNVEDQLNGLVFEYFNKR